MEEELKEINKKLENIMGRILTQPKTWMTYAIN